MKSILIIGSGGREHALALAFAKSDSVNQVFVAPGNPGMDLLKTDFFAKIQCHPIQANDFEGLIAFAKEKQVAFSFVGPEIPLSEGIVDAFRKESLKIVGPTQAASKLEGSKAFAKGIMDRAGIPTAAYQKFEPHQYQEALTYIERGNIPVVIKQDGLAAGKGVVIAETLADAQETLHEMMVTFSNPVVIEEFLTGPEFSFFSLVNEDHIIPIGVAQDFKRAYDNDKGLNTGGMGAYSPVRWVDQALTNQVIEEIIKPLTQQMIKEKVPYTGVLYTGLMLTANGPKVIEYNARFGDPETQILLPLIDMPFDQLIEAHFNKEVIQVPLSDDACMGVVLASKGYPSNYPKGMPLVFADDFPMDQVCFAGVSIKDNQLCTNGGRFLMVTARHQDLETCRQEVYQLLEQIQVEDCFYRRDIALKASKEEKEWI